jgi:hypothetical protein
MKFELRQSIQRHMWKRGWKKTDLANAANLYPSDLSNFMNGNGTRSFPIAALDAITAALELPIAEFYPLYFGECCAKGKIVKHRCEEFLYRCAELRLHDFVEKLIAAMLAESKSHLQTIYSVAKRLFAEEKAEEALPLVNAVIENESNRFSERLAACYFYRFFVVRNRGMDYANHALVQMLEYLAYMPHEIQLEAYLRIITFYNAREDWEFVWEYAKKLEEIAKEGVFYGEALLYQSFALRETGKYEEALRVTDRYAQVNDYFAELAAGNRLLLFIQAGQTSYIDELISLWDAKGKVYLALSKILEAYVKTGELEKAGQFLLRFAQDVKKLEAAPNPLMAKLLLRFRQIHAVYHFQIGNIEKGIDETIEAIRLADELGNTERFKDSLWLYWQYHQYTSARQKAKYEQMLKRSESS